MMVELSTVLTIASLFIGITSLSLSLIAILKVMASEKATHTIYNQGALEAPTDQIDTEELFKDVVGENQEFTHTTSIKDLEKSLLGDFE